MVVRTLTKEQIDEFLELLKLHRHADGRFNLSLASRQSGIPRQTLQNRMSMVQRIYPDIFKPFEPEIEQPIQPKEIVSEKPRYRIAAGSDPVKDEIRVLAIGDMHDSPSLIDKERFRWIARHVRETRPDRVVQIGDIASFDSCSTHEPIGSLGYAQKPSFRQDMDSLEDALTLYYKTLGEHSIPHDITLGNHEYRVFRFEQNNPAVEEGFYSQLQQLMARFGWRSHDFGNYLNIGGVRFTHVPHNQLGRPYGGKNSENQIANDALWSVCYGHTHKAIFKRVPKIGPQESIEVLNLGGAMPENYVAKYASVSVTGWTSGIFDLTIRKGHIAGYHFIPMSSLEAKYRD